MRKALTILAIAATLVVLTTGTIIVVGMPGLNGASSSASSTTTSSGVSTSSSGSSSTTVTVPHANSTVSDDSTHGLLLRLSINATTVAQGHAFSISVSEFNVLTKSNNVSSANLWAADGLELGYCGHSYGPDQGPLGVAVFAGRYTQANVSQAQSLEVFQPTACPQFIRLITGYLFQPSSDDACFLPSCGGDSTPLSGNVTVSDEYAGYSSPGQALSPGLYTVVGGDEWGNLAFLYVTVE